MSKTLNTFLFFVVYYLILGTLLFTFNVYDTQAADFRVSQDTLYIQGYLESTDVQALNWAIASQPEITRVDLNSRGGDAFTGVLLAHAIHLNALDTHVHSQCSSACSYMWLAGKRRTLSERGVVDNHGMYDRVTGKRASGAEAFIMTKLLEDLFAKTQPLHAESLLEIAIGEPQDWYNLNYLKSTDL